LQTSVLAKGDKNGMFWSGLGGHTVCIHDFCPAVHDCHSGSNRRNVENIELSLSEILPAYLVVNCICQLQQKLHIWSGSGAVEH